MAVAADPHTRWQRGPHGEVYGQRSDLSALYEMRRAIDKQILDNVALAPQPPLIVDGARYQKHPTLHNVWVPTNEHPDVGLTPKQIFEKYARRDQRTLEQRDRADHEALLGLADEAEAMVRLTCGLPTRTKEQTEKVLPAMVRVVADKDGKNMRTEAGPTPIDIERVRRETRDHITGNGKPWFTDPNAAPPEAKPIGTTTWCGVCNRNVTGEPCVTVYAGAVKGCSPSGVA